MESLFTSNSSPLNHSSSSYSESPWFPMDDDDILTDTPESEADFLSPEQSDMDKQIASLKSYVGSVPYDCESVKQMQAKLEMIVGKIFICAKSKNWLVLSTWDGLLQCWLLMRYPMPKTTRAKLVHLYYELCLVPAIEPRLIRSWADMIMRLLSAKQGQRRKLESIDLQLPWRPLWRALQKELWPKKRLQDNSRNVVNILLFVTEMCKKYYPADDIPDMLSTFIPITTIQSILTMIPVITSFLPPSHTHTYLPALFKLWEAFNSSVVDDRLLELAGELSEEHVGGKAGLAGEEGGAEWKDVGIWTEEQWTLIIGKGLSSMNVPVGAMRASSSTSSHADSLSNRQSSRIKKTVDRYLAIARTLVYSMSVDGAIRGDSAATPQSPGSTQQIEYLAGSKALDALDRLITSTESFFHPSNSGPWSLHLTSFLKYLMIEFAKRWKEEELETCKTPVTHRLTPSIRRAFVKILRTPALLGMFSKDSTAMNHAQVALRYMAMLEPTLIMPELLGRAYDGLEVVNETHRTTAVLTMLSGISQVLVSENAWIAGQKHLLPLLELCVPGIDLNDPVKTVCATMFIVGAVQHIKIGDLSIHQSGLPLLDNAPPQELMDVDSDVTRLPGGTDIGEMPRLSIDDERSLVRESTAGFADWVTSLFRRVLALYENLPEEGGKKNTTGGKQEENVLKSIKSMLDVVCLHLSDQLFDLVLNLVFNYATTNAKSNAVRAFGQLVACLARAKPEQTIARFLPYCISQVEEELKHGASSIRTTQIHPAVPSDTTLHWNMAIIRGCLGYGGPVLLKYKQQIIRLLALLIDKTKSERGYSGTGHLLTRVLHTLSGVYPINSRFVNGSDWENPEFDRDHNTQWGRQYEPQDVVIEWHVPSEDEIVFILEILDQIIAPTLDKVESLLESTASWDNVSRNDFCRYLQASRSVWSGLPTLYLEQAKEVINPCLNDNIELEGLLASHLDVQAGFTLTDIRDTRYQKVAAHRIRFGNIIQRAASALRQNTESKEDHTDAVLGVAKAIDVFLLEYGMNRSGFNTLQKNYTQARDLNRLWSRQKDNSRLVFVKRAQVYHSGRTYMHALYRRRSALDDQLLKELFELSLSPYVRVRRYSQSVLHSVYGYYMRSTKVTLPSLFDALTKGNDPDRMKGALYILWNKGITSYALSDHDFHGQYLLSLLDCQHEEKPSVQKLVGNVAQDCLSHLYEEAMPTAAYSMAASRVEDALNHLSMEFSPALIDDKILSDAMAQVPVRVTWREAHYDQTVSSILEAALRPTAHWRYVQMATRFLYGLLRRDVPPSAKIAEFFMIHTTSPQPTIRTYSQLAMVKLLTFIKIRTYAKSAEELWLDEWKSPLQSQLPIEHPSTFLENLGRSSNGSDDLFFVDKIPTGFLTWTTSVKGYASVGEGPQALSWERDSLPALKAVRDVISEKYYSTLTLLWGQESNRESGTTDVRDENITFVKSLAKMFEHESLEPLLSAIESLLSDPDRFKQRAGAEILAGLLRGSKHWSQHWLNKLWTWTTTRLDQILAQIKPDTLPIWETVFGVQLGNRDPSRNKPLIDWLLALPLEFNGDSAFAMTKSLSLFGILVDSLRFRFDSMADKYVNLLFDNANTGYADVRGHIATSLVAIMRNQWRPSYSTTDAFLLACRESQDPLHIQKAMYLNHVSEIMDKLPRWKEERLPPPRVSQSEYDKVGLALLQWIWFSAHYSSASLIFPYAVRLMPDILRMSELNDNSELQVYSSAVLYVLSSVTPPREYVEVILDNFVTSIKASTSWRIRLYALPALVVFFYRNLLTISPDGISKVMETMLDCLADENVEVRAMASKSLSGIVRCSQRQKIVPLKNRFVALARKTTVPQRKEPNYAESFRVLHSAILGLCALIESFPYSVEPWMPALAEVLAPHATDPPPISTTIRKCASEFKKTHQDTWHKDQLAFDEDQLQSLSTMLVGTSYYA